MRIMQSLSQDSSLQSVIWSTCPLEYKEANSEYRCYNILMKCVISYCIFCWRNLDPLRIFAFLSWNSSLRGLTCGQRSFIDLYKYYIRKWNSVCAHFECCSVRNLSSHVSVTCCWLYLALNSAAFVFLARCNICSPVICVAVWWFVERTSWWQGDVYTEGTEGNNKHSEHYQIYSHGYGYCDGNCSES